MHHAPLNAVDHYENFPVGSWLVPARLRPAVVAIYGFARHADDLADEGDALPDERLAALEALDRALRGVEPDPPVIARLRPHLQAHALPIAPLRALLSAFAQDVGRVRHADWASLRDYCSRSADPVGELMLRLFRAWDDARRPHSDAICSALQLINFLQDLAIDWRRDRLYLPLDELSAAGLSEHDVQAAVERGSVDARLAHFLAGQAQRAQQLLRSGGALIPLVPWRLGLELRAIIAGGTRIVERLARSGFDPIAARPALGWSDAAALARLWLRVPVQAR